MNQLTRIVVPTKFSPFAQAAFEQAVDPAHLVRAIAQSLIVKSRQLSKEVMVCGADLVVIGTRGRDRLKQVFLKRYSEPTIPAQTPAVPCSVFGVKVNERAKARKP